MNISEVLYGMAQIYYSQNSAPANELRAHPATVSEIYRIFQREWMEKLADYEGRSLMIPLGAGHVQLIADDRLQPGVIFLDRDGKFASNIKGFYVNWAPRHD